MLKVGDRVMVLGTGGWAPGSQGTGGWGPRPPGTLGTIKHVDSSDDNHPYCVKIDNGGRILWGIGPVVFIGDVEGGHHGDR